MHFQDLNQEDKTPKHSSVRHCLVHMNSMGKKSYSGWGEREIAPYNGDWSGRNMGVVFGGGNERKHLGIWRARIYEANFHSPKIWLLEGVVAAGRRDRFWRLFLTIFHSLFINFYLAVIFWPMNLLSKMYFSYQTAFFISETDNLYECLWGYELEKSG